MRQNDNYGPLPKISILDGVYPTIRNLPISAIPTLTKLELFAALAMSGLLANRGPDEWIASDAETQAIKLIERLDSKKNSKT